ncbi:MAG: hypothetical protein Q8880_12690, partial [Bacteroidota bacterium]|nr:hypothetical protein [Bacteroidota bacterium]
MKKLFNVLRKNIFLIEELLHINSIKKKLISSYLIIIVTMSLFFLFIIVYSFYLNSQYNQVITNFTYYNSIHVPLNKLNKEIYLDISEQKKFNKESLEDEISQINANINAIKYDTNNLEISSEIEILKRTVKSLNNYINDIDVLVSNDTDFKVRQAKQEDITETTTLIKDNIQQLMSFDLNYSQKLIRDIRNGFHIMLIVISISFVLTIIASIIFLLAFTSAIADKIIKISDNANKLAATDLNVEEINFNTNDEFKILAYSFNKMKNNIKEYINQISYNEKRISSILNGMSDCVITTDITGSIMTCNNSTKNVFNYFPSE